MWFWVCVLVSVYLCLRASGHKQVCTCYAYAHISLVSDGPRLWLPIHAQTLSSFFMLSPQLSRQHQGFVCWYCFMVFCFVYSVLVFAFVFTETLSYTLSTFLVLVCLSVSPSLCIHLYFCLSLSPSPLYLSLTPQPCLFISLHLSPFPGIIPVFLSLCLCLPPSFPLSLCLYFFSLSLSPTLIYFPLSVSIFLPCWSLALSLFLCVCLSVFFWLPFFFLFLSPLLYVNLFPFSVYFSHPSPPCSYVSIFLFLLLSLSLSPVWLCLTLSFCLYHFPLPLLKAKECVCMCVCIFTHTQLSASPQICGSCEALRGWRGPPTPLISSPCPSTFSWSTGTGSETLGVPWEKFGPSWLRQAQLDWTEKQCRGEPFSREGGGRKTSTQAPHLPTSIPSQPQQELWASLASALLPLLGNLPCYPITPYIPHPALIH